MRQSLSCEIYSKSFGVLFRAKSRSCSCTRLSVKTKCDYMYSKTDTDGGGGPVQLFLTLSEGTVAPCAGVLSASLECTKN